MAILRKIKNKIKAIKDRATKVKRGRSAVKRVTETKSRKKELLPESRFKNEILGAREVAVGTTKFSTPEIIKSSPRPMPQDLPGGYNENKIVLLVRDPWWMYTYWETTGELFEKLRHEYGDVVYHAKKVLRVYDVSHIKFNGRNAHSYYDIEIHPAATNWYINAQAAGRSWCVDLGLILADGRFITLLRSNVVLTPLDGPSLVTGEEEWMIPEEMFARLYGMGFGLGQSSPIGKAWQERVKRELFSGILASPGMASMASPTGAKKQLAKERKFWLIVNTELIVYGATEPDAKVKVQGKAIKLRPDGTFTLRFALPDGKQVIPVEANSADDIDYRVITPIVTRETK